MQSKVPKGLATWAGIVAAVGQYALSVALLMDTFDQADPLAGVAALVTATATLWKVVDGRMKQAQTLARVDGAKQIRMTDRAVARQAAQNLVQVTSGYSGVTGQRAYAGGQFADTTEAEDPDPPEGNTTGCSARP